MTKTGDCKGERRVGRAKRRRKRWLSSREMSLAEKQWGEHILQNKVVFQNPNINSGYETKEVVTFCLVFL